jgi:hypothetical protein
VLTFSIFNHAELLHPQHAVQQKDGFGTRQHPAGIETKKIYISRIQKKDFQHSKEGNFPVPFSQNSLKGTGPLYSHILREKPYGMKPHSSNIPEENKLHESMNFPIYGLNLRNLLGPHLEVG